MQNVAELIVFLKVAMLARNVSGCEAYSSHLRQCRPIARVSSSRPGAGFATVQISAVAENSCGLFM